VKPEITLLKVPPRSQLIRDAIALSQLLLRLERDRMAIDPHASLRLAEIILELYPQGEAK
jgi:hypothetical protein